MKGRKIKVKSYFEITEDPPQVLPPLRKTNRSFKNYKLPTNNGFFFIDFTEGTSSPIQTASYDYSRNVILSTSESHWTSNASARMSSSMSKTPPLPNNNLSSTRNNDSLSGKNEQTLNAS